MATQLVEFVVAEAPHTVRLLTIGSNTIEASSTTLSQRTNAPAMWTAQFTDVAAGTYVVAVLNSGGAQIAYYRVRLVLDDGTFAAYEHTAAPGKWEIAGEEESPELVLYDDDGTEVMRLALSRATSDGTVITGAA